MTIAELSRLIENLIREGMIVSYNPKTYKVRVQTGKLTTDELDFFVPSAGAKFEHYAPAVGESCVLLSPSGNTAAGWVLCGIANDKNQSADTSPDIHMTSYKDGAKISYNYESGELIAAGIKSAKITAENSIDFTAPSITLDGEVTATRSMTVAAVVNANGGIAATQGAGGAGATVKIDVPVVFTKKITSTQIIEDGHSHIAPAGGGNVGLPI